MRLAPALAGAPTGPVESPLLAIEESARAAAETASGHHYSCKTRSTRRQLRLI
jgi:hypothetical protein